MAELWELDVNSSPQKVLVYGDSKVGKTKLVGELAEKFNLIWFDFENGYKTLLSLPMEYKKNISLFRVRDSYTDPVAIQTAGKIADHLDSLSPQPMNICQEHGRVGCLQCRRENKAMKIFDVKDMTPNDILVFDSSTQIATSAFKQSMKQADKNPSLGDKAEFDQWGFQGNLLERFLNAVQNATCHIVVISHETDIEKKDTAEKLVPTIGTRNFSRLSAKYFDHVVRLYKRGREHACSSSTTAFATAVAGSRLALDVKSSLMPLFDVAAYEEAKSSEAESPKKMTTSASTLAARNKFPHLKKG